MNLYYYQQDAIDAVLNHIESKKTNPCIEIPTGGGKTPIIATLCSMFVKNKYRVLICAHRQELLEQTRESLKVWAPNVDFGIVSAGLGKKELGNDVVIAGIQSVYKHGLELGKIDFLIVDEAHMIPASSEKSDGMYATLIDDLKTSNHNLTIIGLTATPYRLSSGEVCGDENILNEICYRVGVQELIDAGKLSKLISKEPPAKLDDAKLVVRNGEYDPSVVEEQFDDTKVYQTTSEIIRYTGMRKSVLIFSPTINVAKAFTKEIVKRTGVKDCVATIFGDTPKDERAETIARFKDGKERIDSLFGEKKAPLKYLVNVDVLTTGFDAKNVDCVVMLRPTKSPGLYYQMVGRGLRLFPGKEDCLVLDFGGNMKRFGPIDAIEPPLKTGERKKKDDEPKMKECPRCYSLSRNNATHCDNCGFEFDPPNDDFLCPSCGAKNAKIARFCISCGFEFPTLESFNEKADFDSAILSSEIKKVFSAGRRVPDFCEKVAKTSYLIGQNKSNGKPPYLMAKHQTESGTEVSEFVCFEHEGWGRQNAIQWWNKRSMIRPIPFTAEQALNIIRLSGIAETKVVVYSPAENIKGKKTYPKFRKAETAEPVEPKEPYPRTDNWINVKCEECFEKYPSFIYEESNGVYSVKCVYCGAVVATFDPYDYDDDEVFRSDVELITQHIKFRHIAKEPEFDEY